ncbi:MAG: hypothetical protein JSU92_13475, partial [Deltaproteobacteria bacterium]
ASGITTSGIQREDVGIKLKITPQINESDYIRMSIATEISEVAESPVEGLDPNVVGLTTSKRAAQTVVVVKDRQAVVIGGLIKDAVIDAEKKVPILGDIPIIGWLFRFTRHRVEKVNLLIFLTPYVIRDGEDIEMVRTMKEEQSQKFELDSFGFKQERKYLMKAPEPKSEVEPKEEAPAVEPKEELPKEELREALPKEEKPDVEPREEMPKEEELREEAPAVEPKEELPKKELREDLPMEEKPEAEPREEIPREEELREETPAVEPKSEVEPKEEELREEEAREGETIEGELKEKERDEEPEERLREEEQDLAPTPSPDEEQLQEGEF